MHYEIHDTDVTVTCTYDDLFTMQANDLKIWGVPLQDELYRFGQIYMGGQAQFKFDRVVATVHDFLDQEGISDLGDYDPDDPELDETICLTVTENDLIARNTD